MAIEFINNNKVVDCLHSKDEGLHFYPNLLSGRPQYQQWLFPVETQIALSRVHGCPHYFPQDQIS